jgi:hypothetical protein
MLALIALSLVADGAFAAIAGLVAQARAYEKRVSTPVGLTKRERELAEGFRFAVTDGVTTRLRRIAKRGPGPCR